MADAVADLTADLTTAADPESLRRVRSLAAAALQARHRGAPDRQDPTPQPHTVLRRDERDLVLGTTTIGPLSGLLPGERLGPFPVETGLPVWFDVFFRSRRLSVVAAGEATPSFVLTQARPPRGTDRTVELGTGTVWVRGDLVDAGLPAGAYVGITVSGGQLTLAAAPSTSGDTITVPTPLDAELRLRPVEEEVSPTGAGCTLAEASVELPTELILSLRNGTTRAKAADGRARAWQQELTFTDCRGTWTQVPLTWTVVLEYAVTPDHLDTDLVASRLLEVGGPARISGGGLGLPVVVADPAILGEAASGPSWWLTVGDLGARWYQPDLRPHRLDPAWIGISEAGTTIAATGAAPLDPPVTSTYQLWEIQGGDGQRLPWRLDHDRDLTLLHRCDVRTGEQLVVNGGCTVALDRPVQTSGAPLETPPGAGTLVLARSGGTDTVLLGSVLPSGSTRVDQLALRNALVWTAPPRAVIVRGTLTAPQQVADGVAQVLIGVHAWAPILPDPYVSNATVQRPPIRGGSPTSSLLTGRITWSAPNAVTVGFAGTLGPPEAIGPRERSDPRPQPMSDRNMSPDVGMTQVEQHRLAHDKEAQALIDRAQEVERSGRDNRLGPAARSNEKIGAVIDGYVSEVLGPTPGVVLLDVSTNQDLLGVAMHGARRDRDGASGGFEVADLAVHAPMARLRVLTLPQVQWEPVRTLDSDQDIITMGWFPTPLASAGDGGPTQLGSRSQKLVPSIPADTLRGTHAAYADGEPVTFRTTLPFGLVTAVSLQPDDTADRRADRYELTRPTFPKVDVVGGLHVTALAEGGRGDDGGISATFQGRMGQLINGVDLASGAPLGLSVLGSAADPSGSVETVFNNDMLANPRVPVTRFDLSGYGGSNFSDWNNPFAAFAEAAKVQFRVVVGRTALEVIKVNSVLHPWGIRVTRSVTVERRPGGGVIRRDSGWQAFTPGLLDYRYHDESLGDIDVAPYTFDAGVFRGLFDVRSIRPAPGNPFSHAGATMVPYLFDADLALDGLTGRTRATGVLGYLQTEPSGAPAPADALEALLQTQGPVGGPVDAWIGFGGSGLPFRVTRIEVGLAYDGADPVFVATARGVPHLPSTGAWSVVVRPVASVPAGGGEAVPVSETRGVPLIRRYPVAYPAGSRATFSEPPLAGTPGDYRLADASDLLTPAAPAHDYALLQSTPTHAFLFPRPTTPGSHQPRIDTTVRPALADVLARATSKGAFPPPENSIELSPGGAHLDVDPDGALGLSAPISIVGHPTPLRISGTDGHGSVLDYTGSTLSLDLQPKRWAAEFTGLEMWSDVAGLRRVTGSRLRVVGSTEQRPQIAEMRTLILQEIEEVLSYIPIFGDRGVQGPIDLGASNAKHELKVEAKYSVTVPPKKLTVPIGPVVTLTLSVASSAGFDLAVGAPTAAAKFGASLDAEIPLYTTGAFTVFLIVTLKVEFSLASLAGTVTSEKLELLAFVGIGVKGTVGPFEAKAFLGIGFVLVYDFVADVTKYGGLVAFEASVDLTIVKVKLRAELKGLVYDDAGVTKCDYSGSVKLQVDIFLVFSISATYALTDTAEI